MQSRERLVDLLAVEPIGLREPLRELLVLRPSDVRLGHEHQVAEVSRAAGPVRAHLVGVVDREHEADLDVALAAEELLDQRDVDAAASAEGERLLVLADGHDDDLGDIITTAQPTGRHRAVHAAGASGLLVAGLVVRDLRDLGVVAEGDELLAGLALEHGGPLLPGDRDLAAVGVHQGHAGGLVQVVQEHVQRSGLLAERLERVGHQGPHLCGDPLVDLAVGDVGEGRQDERQVAVHEGPLTVVLAHLRNREGPLDVGHEVGGDEGTSESDQFCLGHCSTS